MKLMKDLASLYRFYTKIALKSTIVIACIFLPCFIFWGIVSATTGLSKLPDTWPMVWHHLMRTLIYSWIFQNINVGFLIIRDMEQGFTESLLVTPMQRAVYLLALLLKDLTIAVIQSLLHLVCIVALTRHLPSLHESISYILLLFIVPTTMAIVSYLGALVRPNYEEFKSITVIFPLFFLLGSGLTVSPSQLPSTMQPFFWINPFWHLMQVLAWLDQGTIEALTAICHLAYAVAVVVGLFTLSCRRLNRLVPPSN